jgi:predicted GNAT family N-acyltransferase
MVPVGSSATATNDVSPSHRRVFISYAHEDDDYETRVRLFAERLLKDGFEARIDQWHLSAGQDIVEFMSHEIRHADHVLVLCSPKYARKSLEAEEGQGPTGLVWEKRLITTLMTNDPKKVIPILGRGVWKSSAPDFVQGLLYIDLSRGDTFESAYKVLCRRLGGPDEPTKPLTPIAPVSTHKRSSAPAWPSCRVVIACARATVASETLRLVKKWLSDNQRSDVSPIHFSLVDAVEAARGPAVLVAVGFDARELKTILPQGSPRDDLEIVCIRSGLLQSQTSTPSSSLIEPVTTVSCPAGADPTLFLRKAILRSCARQAVQVRLILTERDLEEYFSLRYQVWREMGYLIPDGSLEPPWDVNYTDRTSIALGAYEGGRLVACARLVYGLGEEDRSAVSLIENLLTAKGGASFATRLTIPPGMPPQFDILGAFRGFPAYYRKLVTDRVAKAEVSRVIVAPDHRKHGLGEVIVDSLIALSEHRKLDVLFLACRRSHQRFYERCGFRVIPGMVCEKYINQHESSIAMERNLGGTHES